MGELSAEWKHDFDLCFQQEDEVIEFIFENLDISGFETSYRDAAGYGEPNEMFEITPEDKKEVLYDFCTGLISEKDKLKKALEEKMKFESNPCEKCVYKYKYNPEACEQCARSRRMKGRQ